MSIKGYKITKCGGEQPRPMCVAENSEKSIENEFFILTADNNGKISFKDKNSGRTAENLIEIEDSGIAATLTAMLRAVRLNFSETYPQRLRLPKKTAGAIRLRLKR